MKSLLLMVALLSAIPAMAGSYYKAIVKNVVCTKIDENVVGEVCLIELKRKNSKKDVTLVIEPHDLLGLIKDPRNLEGQSVLVNQSLVSKIKNKDVIRALKEFNSDHFYMNAKAEALEVLPVTRQSAMEVLVERYQGYFLVDSLPLGFSAKKLTTKDLGSNFKAVLAKMAFEKRADWKRYVLKGGEYSGTQEELNDIAANPLRELRVKYLLEVDDFYAIYFKGEHVGYWADVLDHVFAAIIQDGAWYNMFLDAKQQLLKAFDEAS